MVDRVEQLSPGQRLIAGLLRNTNSTAATNKQTTAEYTRFSAEMLNAAVAFAAISDLRAGPHDNRAARTEADAEIEWSSNAHTASDAFPLFDFPRSALRPRNPGKIPPLFSFLCSTNPNCSFGYSCSCRVHALVSFASNPNSIPDLRASAAVCYIVLGSWCERGRSGVRSRV